MRALLSVSDRRGLVDLASSLVSSGFELISTGGTASELVSDGGLSVIQVAELTGFPEILDGRVKTLHPKIHGGILARRDSAEHVSELSKLNVETIDMVVSNLYPFVKVVSDPKISIDVALENIDIGGPAMVRAAAKNFPHVVVIVDPGDYGWIEERISSGGLLSITLEERRKLAQKAFQHVAFYDTAISSYLGVGDRLDHDEITFGYSKIRDMRYGENPHQKASVYTSPLSIGGIVRADQLHGIELSFNNILDAESVWSAVSDFGESTAAIVKHTNTCGLSIHSDQPTAYLRAFEGDPVSAYGGVVGFNRIVMAETAEAMKGVFYDIIVAPDYESEALEMFRKRKQTRILRVSPESGFLSKIDVRKVSGGAIIQTSDTVDENVKSWTVVTDIYPGEKEFTDLAFAWKVAGHIKSNAMVLAKDLTLIGMGAGQPNRVTSMHLALRIAGDKADGSVLASDAFIPFSDSLEMAKDGGVVSLVQPGGSIRDKEVIETANRLGLAMVFTGVRHFKH